MPTTLFTVPTSTAGGLTALVSGQITDPGFLALLVVAIAVPLAFVVAHGIKGLITGRGRRA